MELVELGGELPRVTAPTLSPQATAGLCTPRPEISGALLLLGGGVEGGGQMEGVMEQWGWGELSLGSPEGSRAWRPLGLARLPPLALNRANVGWGLGGPKKGPSWVGN